MFACTQLLESIRREPLDPETEEAIMSIGLVVLLGLGMFMILSDVTRLGG